MAEGNTSDGHRKSRSILGDLTNRIDGSVISGSGTRGIKSVDLDDRDVVKRIRISPRPCTEINSLKGNVISGISKVVSGNKGPNVPCLSNVNAVSKSSTDVDTDCDGSCFSKGKNVVMGNSKVHGGNDDIRILDLAGRDASQSVHKLEPTKNDLVANCGKLPHSEDSAILIMDKIANQDDKSSNLVDLEGRRDVNSVAAEADGCGELHLLKKNVSLIISEVAAENKCPRIQSSAGKNAVDIATADGLGSSNVLNEDNDPNKLDLGHGDAVRYIDNEVIDWLGESFHADCSRTANECGGDCLHDDISHNAGEVNANLEGTQSDTKFCHNDMNDHNADNFILSQSGSIDCTILPESQESRVFGADRSTKMMEDECAQGADSIRACSCSFCTKAGHILLDLHHQDIKARVSAIKKSQKQASILAERSCRSKVMEKSAESSNEFCKLESHLMYQWRSLFQHMANTWEEEGNQLEASLLQLTDLREKCKADLDLINAKSAEKH